MPGSRRYPGTERYQSPESEVARSVVGSEPQWGYSGNSGTTGGGAVQWELDPRGKAGAAEHGSWSRERGSRMPWPLHLHSSTHISLVEKGLLLKTGMPKGQGAKLKKGEWGQSERVSWAEASKNV